MTGYNRPSEKERFNMKAKVFVTQERAHINYEQAEQFGEVVFVSLTDLPTVSSSLRAKKEMESIQLAMKDYRAGTDFILPSGSPLNIASVMIIAGRRGDRHNILKWESRSNSYSRVAIEVPA